MNEMRLQIERRMVKLCRQGKMITHSGQGTKGTKEASACARRQKFYITEPKNMRGFGLAPE